MSTDNNQPQYPTHQPQLPKKPKSGKGKKFLAVAGGVLILFVGIGLGASGGDTDPTAATTAPTTTEPTPTPEPEPEPTQTATQPPAPEPAPAPEFTTDEQLFLSVVKSEADTTGWTDQKLVNTAHSICTRITNGETFVDVFLTYVGTGDEGVAGAIAGAGTIMFCPEHEAQMTKAMNQFAS